jgi:BirA family biotin operon repressor/biotin-[acetyl-CoA-carboxylase] ligase
MAWAKEHLADAPDGSVFIADTLQEAQGRQGRIWQLAPGQLQITIMLKPHILASLSKEDLPIRLNQLNMALALGILEPLKKYNTGLKWPNDFIINNKKIAGMLIHLVWLNNLPAGIILGFAINVNNTFDPSDELYSIATSLSAASGTTLDMRALYKELLVSLDRLYTSWKNGQFDDIYRAWRSSQIYLGKNITIHQKDGSVLSGTMGQVLPNGDLMLKTNDKKQLIVSFYQVEEVRV